jgi:hypothetical protein
MPVMISAAELRATARRTANEGDRAVRERGNAAVDDGDPEDIGSKGDAGRVAVVIV